MTIRLHFVRKAAAHREKSNLAVADTSSHHIPPTQPRLANPTRIQLTRSISTQPTAHTHVGPTMVVDAWHLDQDFFFTNSTHALEDAARLAGWLAIAIAIAISTYSPVNRHSKHSTAQSTQDEFPSFSCACLAYLCQPHANWAERARNSQQQRPRTRQTAAKKNLTMPRCPTYRVLLSDNLSPPLASIHVPHPCTAAQRE